MQPDQDIPDPHQDWRGPRQQKPRNLLRQAYKWAFTNLLIEPLATIAIYAVRVIDKTTGIPYSADELEAKILAAYSAHTHVSADISDKSAGGRGADDDGLVPTYSGGGGLKASTSVKLYSTLSDAEVTITADELTADRSHSLPDGDGELGLAMFPAPDTPLNGFTITASRYRDELHYLTPAGVLATGSFNLPSAANSRPGQIVRLVTSQNITSCTVAVSGGGTILGTAITAATVTANTPYTWQCLSSLGSGIWIRLS